MDINALLYDLLFDYTLRTVALGAGVIGIVSGVLGCFALLRKQSLLGDAISHAALPGVVIAFMLTGSRASLVLMVGAAIAGWLATLLIRAVINNTRIKEDSALGLALSVFFGVGLMLLSFTQRMSTARQAGLDRFLFGQAATMLERDIITMSIVGVIALAIVILYWKEFKLISFDAEFAASMGMPVRALEIGLTTLYVIAIVIGLQAVGVILMSAMVVAPAAAARQWTNRLSIMVVLAGLFGALSGSIGAIISSSAAGLSTGPVIVLLVSMITIASMLFAPSRGLLWTWLQRYRNRNRLRLEKVLFDLRSLAQQHADPDYGHSISVLRTMNGFQGGVEHTLHTLRERQMVKEVGPNQWALTPAGRKEAERLQYQLEHQTDGQQVGDVYLGVGL